MAKHAKNTSHSTPPAAVLRRLCLALSASDSVETLLLAEKCFISLQNHHGSDTPFRVEWGDVSLVRARSHWLYKINKPGLEMLRLHLGECAKYMIDNEHGRFEVCCHMMAILSSEVSTAE